MSKQQVITESSWGAPRGLEGTLGEFRGELKKQKRSDQPFPTPLSQEPRRQGEQWRSKGLPGEQLWVPISGL